MKKTTLSQFNGGIVNGLAATKVDPTTASNLLDADIRFGDLRPVTSDMGAGSVPDGWTLQDGNRSVVKFGKYYYWVDNTTSELNSTIGYFGVEYPLSKMTLLGGNRGSRLIGRYRYTYTFMTKDGFESRPSTLPNGFGIANESITEINTEYLVDITNYEDLLRGTPEFDPKHKLSSRFHGYDEGSLVVVDDVVYRARMTITAMNDSRQAEIYGNGGVNGEPPFSVRAHQGHHHQTMPYIFPWQYPDTNSGQEFWKRVPVEIVGERYAGYDSIYLRNIGRPDSEDGDNSIITRVNIYRTVADGDVFFQVASLDAGITSWIDTVSDQQATSGEPLNTNPITPPVQEFDQFGALETLPVKFLTEQLGIFYLASGDRVYLSEQDNPHAWDVRKFLELEDTCTGIARYRDGVLAFTRNRTYQITGSSLLDFRLRWIPELQGCKDWRTISYLNNNPTWISNDGMCQYGFVPEIQAELLQTLTVGKFDWPTIVWAVVANRKYYGITDDNRAIIYDFERGGAISAITLDASYAEYDPDSDQIVYRDKIGNDMQVGGGAVREWTYESPVFTFESNELKRLRSLWFRCDADVTVAVEVDGNQLFSGQSVAGLPYRRLFVPSGLTGTQFRFIFKSKGKMDQVSFEYNEVKR